MTHSPPVPPASQSPFPLHEAPHEHQSAPLPHAPILKPVEPALNGVTIGVGVAIGIGAAALFGAWLFSRGSAKPAPRKTPTRRAPAAKRKASSIASAPAKPRATRRKRATANSDAPKS